eukprot:TRINITY_DN3331_c0_g1_i3.p1 TRINITY_DN3331_c0_g1~~TRINITY_DN3331_c0_g1_i3.p1  ORF type:complete len:297 (-),score=69.29 TRINITY_DN3331_c0_g1_i3:58-948(-)
MQSVKVVVVGDGATGKTTFLFTFALGCLPTDYVPTTFDNYSGVYNLEGREISLGLWDTAGQSDFKALRPVSYSQSDCYLVFYSVVNPTSYENVKEQWIHEVRQYSPDVPIFLIGTQCDRRGDKDILETLSSRNEKPLTMKDGKKMAKDIGAAAYIEISAKDTSTYGDLWETVLRYTINEHKSQKKHGKNCWSIQCPAKITPINRVTCQGRCKLYYCEDCMEYWGDGRKLCPQCVMYAQTELEEQGKAQPDVKKKRLPPSARAAIELEKEAKKLEKLKKKYEKEFAKQGKTIEEAIR